MLSKSRIQVIRSLKMKKYRDIRRQFLAEGSKLVVDLLQSGYPVTEIFALDDWLSKNRELVDKSSVPYNLVSERIMDQISALSTPSQVLAVATIPESRFNDSVVMNELVLALDDIRDPGNLGTIIRLADWFGIGTVFCSETTVDLYNPKTIQATMGSVARVNVIFGNLPAFLEKVSPDCPVYGTFLEGEPIYSAGLSKNGVIVIGNESAGISVQAGKWINRKLVIPFYPQGRNKMGRPESLNASVAAAIACSEFRRRN